jgi:hypothetical protein
MVNTKISTGIGAVGALVLTGSISVAAGAEGSVNSWRAWLLEHIETSWSGQSELWLDPMGNEALISDATLAVGNDSIRYTWVYQGAEKTGELRWKDDALSWCDSWHQPDCVSLTSVPGHGSIVAAEYSYEAGTGPDWHWRIKIAERPDGALVLQMTNIAPWGEETRAVRTVVHRKVD